MQCSHCGIENPEDARFCESCGTPFSRACPKCGKVVSLQAKFCKNCGGELSIPAATPAPSSASSLTSPQFSALPALREKIHSESANIESERKPVTIMFTDIVSSTSLAEHLDPEDWREVVSGAHRIVSEAVYRYEGTIAQLLGDGVLAFFGAPITHEDDPLRAVYAGLDIQAEISLYAEKIAQVVPNLQMRIGINTGTVVVGNLGHDMHMEYLAVGDAVNLAARLQSAADPGKIVIADRTMRFIQHAVNLQDLGEISLKGKNEPVHIYQVEGIKPVPGRGRGLQGVEGSFVGRQADLETLLQTSAAVQAGLGRIVILVGDPGLGKTRLLAEWRQAAGDELSWRKSAGLSYERVSPFHLVLDLLRALMGITTASSESDSNLALSRLVNDLLGSDDLEAYVFLAHLLSLQPGREAEPVLRGLDPRTVFTQYVASLRRLLIALARRKPLAIVFEDIHWADKASVDVLIQLLSIAREEAVLFCFTTRPDPDSPGWGLVSAARNMFGAGLTEINLEPLSSKEVGLLASNLLAADHLPSELHEMILEKTEGNPLFVEGVISALIEAGVLTMRYGRLEEVGNLANVDIPDNLKRLILARIDRLAEESKRTLRVASVLGREFVLRLLDAVLAGVGEAEPRSQLLNQLSDLEATSLIQLAFTRPEIGYLFRHALIQEATYEALLKADRRRLHQAAAEALEQLYPGQLDELATTLAYHFERAQDRQRSLVYLERAADSARLKYANAEALALYRAAIEQAEALYQAGEANDERRAGLYEKLGNVQLLIGLHEASRASFEQALGLTSSGQELISARRMRQIGNAWMLPREFAKALEAFDQAAKILGEPNIDRNPVWQTERLDLQLDRLWALYWMFDVPRMEETIQLIQPDIEAVGSASQRSVFYGRLVTLAFRRDRYVISDETLQYARLSKHFAEQAALQTGELTNLLLSPFGLGFTCLWHGDFVEADANFEEVLQLAERTGNQEQRVLALTYRAWLHRLIGDVHGVQEYASHALQAAQAARMPVYISLATANLAWMYLQRGDIARAETNAKAALAALPPAMPAYSIAAWPMIAIYMSRSKIDDAIKLVSAIVQPTHYKLSEPLEAAIQTAIQLYDSGEIEQAREQLAVALHLAQESREGLPTPT